MRPATLALAAFIVPSLAHAREPKPFVVVVPVEGAPIAREVARELYELGHTVERGGSATAPGPSVALPVDAAKACVADGHGLAFRLEFAAAIRRLDECEEKLGGALARPEGIPALSALLVELAAASIGAGDRERARTAFAKLARLEGAVAPDPALQPPEVMSLWEEVKREAPAARTVAVEVAPRWTKAWVDGKPVAPGARTQLLTPGAHFAIAEAAGFAPFAGVVVVEPADARLAFRLAPLEGDAKYAAVQAASGWIFRTDDADAAGPLTDAFNAPVLLVGGTGGRGATGVLFLPATAGAPARVAGRWTAVGENAPKTIAKNASRALGVRDAPSRRTLVYVGGAVAAVLAAGAVATLAQPRTRTGDKNGSVVFE